MNQPPPSHLPDIHRLLPQSSDAEQGVLASILLAPGDLLDEVRARLKPEAMHIPAHAIIYEQMLAMGEERVPIDVISLIQRLRDRNTLADVGGPGFITSLLSFLPTTANWRHYTDTVAQKHLLRGMIRLFTEGAGRSYDEQAQDPRDLLEEIITRAVDLGVRGDDEHVKHIESFAAAAYDTAEYAYRNRGGTIGIPTGFVDLDRMVGGWQKGKTIYIGGRPGMGKSSLGMNFAWEVAAHTVAHGIPVLFFSVEMTGLELAERVACTLASISQQRMRDGFLEKGGLEKIKDACQRLASSRIWLDESAALTSLDFRARARRFVKQMRRRNGLRKDGKPDALLIIDYLQRMKGTSKRSVDARYLELQEIAQAISQVAKEMEIPIIVLAQLKRPRDRKPESEPDMSEFRECGDIEQEAHIVGLIHRPFYYVKHSLDRQTALAEEMEQRFKLEAKHRRQDPDSVSFDIADLEQYAKLIIDKQRAGPVGPIDLRFTGALTKFETWDVERRRYSNNPKQRQMVEMTNGE